MRTKITYIVSKVHRVIAFEWVHRCLDKEKYELSFILLNPGDSLLERYLLHNKVAFLRVNYGGKKDIPRALLATYNFLRREKIDVVHAHLFDASLIGLLAAWLAGIKKRVHTRHNSTINHAYFPHAVKYDRLINRLSTHIIAITKIVEEILVTWEKADARKVALIHHGFDLREFDEVPDERVQALRLKYRIGDRSPVIGVISRHIHWKGVQDAVAAFTRFQEANPNALLLLANASGPYAAELKKLLRELPPGSYLEIPFEEDVFAFYKLLDIFVHVPIDKYSEAFGQVYVEALAAGVPSIFTLSGIANEFIVGGKNAMTVPYQDPGAIFEALSELWDRPQLRARLKANGREDAKSMFELGTMMRSLESFYETL